MAETMLIIDDEDIVLESCRRIFSAEGFQVSCTTSPPEGLRLIADSFFDAILCDWKMPEQDGMYLMRAVKKQWPEIPIVVMSGYPTPETIAEGL